VKTQLRKDVIEGRYLDLLNLAFEEVIGFPVEISVVLEEDARENEASLLTQADPGPKPGGAPGGEYDYTFSTFIVGASNKFAHAASLAVATNPATSYNPLFIYGGSGLGKTHLLCAICTEIMQSRPSCKIIYVKGEDFTNELITAIQNNSTRQFHDKYRQVDILLVDDIQFTAERFPHKRSFSTRSTRCTMPESRLC
jgi:chromosomal replication initiator protein